MPLPLPRRTVPALIVALLALAVGGGPWSAVPAPAQEVQDLVAEQNLEYRSAKNAHQSALDARAAAERRFNRALQEIRDAQEEGDEDRLRQAYARAQEQALQLQSLEERVRERAAEVERARQALLDVLDRQVERMMAELGETTDPDEQADLAALVRELNVRIREVEREGEVLEEEARLVALPEIAWDPRDGPEELRWKAELLERRARQYAARIDEIAVQIEDLRRRQRRNRSLSDLVTGIQRFDDDQVPVVSPSEDGGSQAGGGVDGGGEEEGEEGESTETSSLDDRIESLELLRERIEEFREQVLFRARQFRDQATEISS